MAILTEDMKRVVREQRLGFYGTVCEDGYRFKGPGEIHDRGTRGYAEGIERLRKAGSTLVDRVKAIVLIEVREARDVVSPIYDDGTLTEADVISTFRARLLARSSGGHHGNPGPSHEWS